MITKVVKIAQYYSLLITVRILILTMIRFLQKIKIKMGNMNLFPTTMNQNIPNVRNARIQ